MKRKFAVFDIDGTLHNSALGVHLLLQLSRDKHIPVDLEEHVTLWRSTQPHQRMAYFREHFIPIYTEHLPGIPKKIFEQTGTKLAHAIHQTITPALQREIELRQSEGYFLMAISNSPLLAVKPLAQLLKFDAWRAGIFEFDADSMFVRPAPHTEDSRNKGALLKQLVEEHGLTWQESMAYGDAIEDLPMLELVEYPVAVNPTSELRAEAVSNKWRILEEKE